MDEDILAIVVRLGAVHPMPADVLTAIISALCTTAAWQKAVPMLQYYRGKDRQLHVPIVSVLGFRTDKDMKLHVTIVFTI